MRNETKQAVRNGLSDIEDRARALRNDMRRDNRDFSIYMDDAFDLITNLTKIIREDIVQ